MLTQSYILSPLLDAWHSRTLADAMPADAVPVAEGVDLWEALTEGAFNAYAESIGLDDLQEFEDAIREAIARLDDAGVVHYFPLRDHPTWWEVRPAPSDAETRVRLSLADTHGSITAAHTGGDHWLPSRTFADGRKAYIAGDDGPVRERTKPCSIEVFDAAGELLRSLPFPTYRLALDHLGVMP